MKHHLTKVLPERGEEQELSLKWSLVGKQQPVKNSVFRDSPVWGICLLGKNVFLGKCQPRAMLLVERREKGHYRKWKEPTHASLWELLKLRLNWCHSSGKQQERLMTKGRIYCLQLVVTDSKEPLIFIQPGEVQCKNRRGNPLFCYRKRAGRTLC